MVEAWVNRDPEQYSATDDAYDARLLSWMIDALLPKRDAPWPESGKGDEAGPTHRAQEAALRRP